MKWRIRSIGTRRRYKDPFEEASNLRSGQTRIVTLGVEAEIDGKSTRIVVEVPMWESVPPEATAFVKPDEPPWVEGEPPGWMMPGIREEAERLSRYV